ncbi:MAG: hypothetical protein COB85_03155 [Bacteroidetes bacterium]|nr:MAG: hypothetical protein COB85_03155 [Bacteroidota bacterium]
MKVKSVLFLFLLIASLFLQAQDTMRKLSISQLYNEINASTDWAYRLTNAVISPAEEDSVFLGTMKYTVNNAHGTYTNYTIARLKDKKLIFKDCRFIFPTNSIFTFMYCTFNMLAFENCDFQTDFRIWRCKIERDKGGNSAFFSLDSCVFNGSFVFDPEEFSGHDALSNLNINNCVFNRYVSIRDGVLNLNIENSDFSVEKVPDEYKGNALNQLNISGHDYENIRISYCKFSSNGFENTNSITLAKTSVERLMLSDNLIGSIGFSGATVSKSFYAKSVEIGGDIGVEGFDFPLNNSNVPWHYISGEKLCLMLSYSTDSPYKANTEDNLNKENKYNDLIAAYKKFHNMYLTRGDMVSANACYIEMKNIETRRNKYLNKVNPNLENYLNYNLNVFLRYFSAYGTSPVRSLIVSFYVVLIFAFFYFFFYSEWDKIDRRYLMQKHRILVEYLKSDQSLEDFYTQEYKEDFQSFKDFKEHIENSKRSIPFFVDALGRPLYRLSKFKHSIMSWIYRRSEILHGRWIDLSSGKKWIVGTTLFAGITFYLTYILFLRVLNSVVLSLNTFSTLGFGDIPVKGISRYLAIVEGFIGWFLLTLFSVSLISQILQS